MDHSRTKHMLLVSSLAVSQSPLTVLFGFKENNLSELAQTKYLIFLKMSMTVSIIKIEQALIKIRRFSLG